MSPPPPPSSPPLFTLPIPTPTAPTGYITCTTPSPKIYLLTFSSPPDNRLTPSFCTALHLALDILLHRYPKGVVVTTSAISKFYSNGLDYESAIKTKDFFPKILYPLWRRLLTYPMPTLALLNGHAFAGGLMTAMMHDYRIMNPSRGYLCLNELDFGAPLLPPMASIFRQKVPSPTTYRALVLESTRFAGPAAFEKGLVDVLGGLGETEAFVRDRRLVGRAESGVYGRLKGEMWRETVAFLDGGGSSERATGEDVRNVERREEEARRRVDEWWTAKESQGTKSKL